MMVNTADTWEKSELGSFHSETYPAVGLSVEDIWQLQVFLHQVQRGTQILITCFFIQLP